VALAVALYLCLFAAAAFNLVRFARTYRQSEGGLAQWQLLSLAPMLVAVVGSFISLPILLFIVALGKVM
jgi:hypothetical protein